MMTSSNGNIFRVTGNLHGEFPGPRWIPHTKASDAGFDVFFDLRLNKRLSKQSWCWWFETLSCPLWRQCIEYLPPPYQSLQLQSSSSFPTHLSRHVRRNLENLVWSGQVWGLLKLRSLTMTIKKFSISQKNTWHVFSSHLKYERGI